jgi:predicted GIY-YIG superfamily endonuclease
MDYIHVLQPKNQENYQFFKHTDINIAFKSNNSIQRLTNTDTTNKTQKYKSSAIYALTCKTCKHKYIGQSSRDLKQRYQEHTQYIRNNNPQSAFALHIVDNKHEHGTIEEIMELIKPIRNTRRLIPFELFYIQKHYQQNRLITEQHPGEQNPLIQLAIDTTATSHEQLT